MTEGVLIDVRVTPRAARDEVAGYDGAVLQVRLRAPPVDGRANESLPRLLATILDLAPRDVEVVSGLRSRSKRVRVTGLARETIEIRLHAAVAAGSRDGRSKSPC
jgi:uncharacterized protein (TIGR00251 family)